MALHITRGKEGEALALEFLRKKDFDILVCNWRHSHYEIDIIATKNGVVHFIEVKTRHSRKFGYPEEGVSKKKFANLKKGAEYFMHRFPIWKRLQFDILAISVSKNNKEEFFFIEDVYM
ncbi:MAG: YraN family protein [Chitinophagaceae bacterium]|nr:YraN family protein [Chitinophagaceae bacterium]